MQQMKTCFKCGQKKPLDEFYRHPRMADGHLNKCKECTKRDVAENYIARHEQYVRYDHERSVLPHRRLAVKRYAAAHPEIINKGHQRYRMRYPDKYIAHSKLNNAIRDGRLVRQPCQVCGSPKAEAHHTDYFKPLDVKWLCRKHHLMEHGKTPSEPVLMRSSAGDQDMFLCPHCSHKGPDFLSTGERDSKLYWCPQCHKPSPPSRCVVREEADILGDLTTAFGMKEKNRD